ncbi:unnamed protein product [Leptidea sinapis]|uniref:Major facilitator superfamily (MFS) profile domain-containing protein n=1 Tax=Leptidea sinapis TaxID=189913 RepID=A0A5E4QS57_9NEOP|nr:unnamed protein product [Leptidea sinapis]
MSSWTRELDEAAVLATSRGWWHELLFYLLCGLAAIPTSFLVFSTVFINATPEHWCALHPRIEKLGIEDQLIRNLTVPGHHGVFESCRAHNIDPDDFFAIYNQTFGGIGDSEMNEGTTDLLIRVINSSKSKEPSECKHGWKFSTDLYKNTLVTEYSLVCNKDWLPRTANTLFWVGSIVGNPFFGWVSDRYGRRPTILLMIFLLVPITIATSFPGNYLTYIVLRIIGGLFFPAMYQLPLILALELMPPAKRTNAGIVIGMLFGSGMCILSLIAYLLREWFYLSLATTLPFILTYSYFWLIPESPRWLVGRGRIADAEKVLRNIARRNGITLPCGFLLDLHKRIKEEEEIEIFSNGQLKSFTRSYDLEVDANKDFNKDVFLENDILKDDKTGEEKEVVIDETENISICNEVKRTSIELESHEMETPNMVQTDPFLKVQINSLRRKSKQFVNKIFSNEDDDDDLDENKVMYEQHSENDCEASPLDLFRYRNIRKKFLILTFNWVSVGIAYNGLSYNTTNLGVNDYLAFFIGGIVELPSYVIAWHCIEKYGRRWVFFGFMIIGGIACLSCGLVPEDLPWVTLTLAMLGRLSAAASFAVFYVQVGELLPTVLRAQAMGAASFISGVGLLACPYIVSLGVIRKWVPLIIIGTLSVAAGFASLFLPETLNHPLPQTLGDGENFGRNFKILSCVERDKKY